MDTTDGVLMVNAYAWAFVDPLRKIRYNLTITSLSIGAALIIGTIELLQVFIHRLRLEGAFFDAVAALDFGVIGCVMVGVFIVAWGTSALVWKVARFDEGRAPAQARDGGPTPPHRPSYVRARGEVTGRSLR